MKSTLLTRQLRDIFGGEGESQLRQLLTLIADDHPVLANGLERLLSAADRTYVQYASLQHWQAEISGDTYSDWNMKTGQVESGRQWKSLLGYAPEEVDNSLVAWQRLVHPEDLAGFQSAVSNHVQGRAAVFSAECRMQAKGSAWKWLLLKGVVTARDAAGLPLRMLVLHRDMSVSKGTEAAMLSAKEAAEEASKARGAFLANMSHEVRTPLNGIIGMTELALDTELDAEQRHYLKTVKSSADSLLHIVNEILDFSKIEAGKLQFETIVFALHDLIFDVVRVMSIAAHKKGLEVMVDIALNVPSRAVGDPTRLRQVLTNLLGNAIKFTEHGEVIIRVQVEQMERSSAHLHFSVHDSGIGIPEDKQQAIFEAFSQADVSTTRRFGGTGLGLAICQRLVHLMDGRIWLESVEGQGTCFHFSVRLGCEPAGREEKMPSRLADKRVLLIEDHPLVAQQLSDFLEQMGMRPSVAGEAAEGFALVERSRQSGFPYDYILIDSTMPEPAGFALVESWRDTGQIEHLVVLITAENQRLDLARLRELGVKAHLVKPVARQDLVDALVLAGEKEPGKAKGGSVELGAFEIDDFMLDDRPGLEILLAEDNPVNQELAVKLLEKRHHRVTIANNGAEAVDWFEKQKFDVIFMDVQMPVMGGIEATEAIRAREMRRSWVMSEIFKTAYIVAMTANAMEADRLQCQQAGMNDFLSKPLCPEDLDAALKRAMGDESPSFRDSPHAAPALVDVQILDLAAALKNIGDRDLLVHMAKMMLDEWSVNVRRVELALESKQARDLHMHVHSLKGLLSIFHAEASRQAALDLEKAANAGCDANWEICQTLFQKLTLELNQLKPQIERFACGEDSQ